MTKSEWLAIASIATSLLTMLLAPLWTAWVLSRLSGQTPRADAANIEKLVRRVGRLLNQVVTSPFVFPSFNILLNIGLIVRYLHVNDVVTKKFVFDVSTSVGIIVFSALQGFSVWIHRRQLAILAGLSEIVAAHHETIGDLVKLSRSGSDIQEDVQKTLQGLQENQKATTGLLEQFVTKEQVKKPIKRSSLLQTKQDDRSSHETKS